MTPVSGGGLTGIRHFRRLVFREQGQHVRRESPFRIPAMAAEAAEPLDREGSATCPGAGVPGDCGDCLRNFAAAVRFNDTPNTGTFPPFTAISAAMQPAFGLPAAAVAIAAKSFFVGVATSGFFFARRSEFVASRAAFSLMTRRARPARRSPVVWVTASKAAAAEFIVI